MLLSFALQVYKKLLAGESFDQSHVSAWHNFNVARTFLDLGFEVDVIPFDDDKIVPEGPYDVAVDVLANLGRLSDSLGSECIKILHPYFAHWAVNNARSYARHAALLERRGVALEPLRLMPPNDSMDVADSIISHGSDFGCGSYSHGLIPVTRVPQIRPAAINELLDRDMEKCKRKFLWLGGYGAIHKGLDLVLDAFSDLPDCELYVAGKFSREQSFEDLYRRELYELPNIHCLGWVDTMSEDFRRIASKCVALVCPSSSEMSCGAVIVGMMNGMIPVTTAGADIDVSEIGFSIEPDTVDAVREAVMKVSATPTTELSDMSRASWEAQRSRYGREKFLASFRQAICRLLEMDPPSLWETPEESPRIPDIALRTA